MRTLERRLISTFTSLWKFSKVTGYSGEVNAATLIITGPLYYCGPNNKKNLQPLTQLFRSYSTNRSQITAFGAWGGTLGPFGWGCAAGTLEPLAYTRASSAEFCYPILD